jgi:hypothetical protein
VLNDDSAMKPDLEKLRNLFSQNFEIKNSSKCCQRVQSINKGKDLEESDSQPQNPRNSPAIPVVLRFRIKKI